MLSKEQCVDILGSAKVSEITDKLKTKNLNDETINRALDYLALHKKCFPYLDNAELTQNLIQNLNGNINYYNALESLKFRRNVAGFTNGQEIHISKRKLNQFAMPDKLIQKQIDHIIRHELEHVAMTRFTDLDTDEKLKKHIESNIEKANIAFGVGEIPDIRPYIEEQKRRLNENNKNSSISPTMYNETGISGNPKSPFRFGSTPLNEGITELKTKLMDDQANRDGYIWRSGYDKLETKIARHMSKIIGIERFLKMHQNGDFVGITQTYKERMGRDNTYMREFYTELEKPHNQPIKSISEKLFGTIGKEIVESATNLINKIHKPKEKEGGEFVKSFLE